MTREEAYRIQEELAKRVIIENGFEDIASIGAADVAFSGDRAYAALVVYSYPELAKLEEVVVEGKVTCPYIPGLLSFREGPVLLMACRATRREPDLMLFDGQGIAHPRRFGLASHMGILLDRPAIGCAKSRLSGEYGRLGHGKGSVTPLWVDGQTVGSVVRTRERVKPVYVSPGHLVDLETSVAIVLSCISRYRIPEPLREADLLGRRRSRRTRGRGLLNAERV